jgi:nitrous oxidase accessory protein NosD
MKKIILQTAAVMLILAGGFYSCAEENSIQQNIMGIWLKETTNVDGTGDTIVFTNDYKVEKYFKYDEDGYRIDYKIKTDTVFISVNSLDNFIAKESFKYSINGNELTIFRFTYPFSLAAVERADVIFRKIE